MEKRANNSILRPLLYFWVFGLILFSGSHSYAQNESFVKGKSYILDSISVSGIKTFNTQTVISYSGLNKGQKINVPGEDVSAVIKKLWGLELFSDINFYATKVDGNKISIEIEIKELPTLSNVKVQGIKKNKIQSIKDDTDLKPGKKLSESFPEFQPSNYIYHTQEIFEYLYKGFGHNDSSSLIIVNKKNEVLQMKLFGPQHQIQPLNIFYLYLVKFLVQIHYHLENQQAHQHNRKKFHLRP